MKSKRIIAGVAGCTAFTLVALLVYPIRSTGIKGLLLLCFGFCCFALVYFVRSRVWKIALCAMLLVPFLIIAFGPHRPADSSTLRASYVASLTSYEGITYVWGGENRRGVDCSGLVRAAWIDAQFKVGVRQLNPGLIRDAASQWWFDASAFELGNGYGRRTQRITETNMVRVINPDVLLPGDLAVVGNGVHVMAYLGENQWIEADPAERRVIKLHVHDKNPWLDSKPLVVRWAALNSTNL